MRISDWSSDVCSSDLPWWVALEHAQEEISAPVRIALHGLAVASSGDAFQHFTVNGRRYSHTLDPRSGWPVSNVLAGVTVLRSEEHTSELQSLMRISYAVFCLKKKKQQ